jgi:hypothetical protein
VATESDVYRLAGGDIVVWRDAGGVIFLKVEEKYRDPVELAEHEALELGELLVRLARTDQ